MSLLLLSSWEDDQIPEMMVKALLMLGDHTREGVLVQAVALPWFRFLMFSFATPIASTRSIHEPGSRSLLVHIAEPDLTTWFSRREAATRGVTS